MPEPGEEMPALDPVSSVVAKNETWNGEAAGRKVPNSRLTPAKDLSRSNVPFEQPFETLFSATNVMTIQSQCGGMGGSSDCPKIRSRIRMTRWCDSAPDDPR
jgi:hypothetical protein